jgi:DNA-binding MarR family transcriptional regulator
MAEAAPSRWTHPQIRDYLIAIANRVAQALEEDERGLDKLLDVRDKRLLNPPPRIYIEKWVCGLEISGVLEECISGWPVMDSTIGMVLSLMPDQLFTTLFRLLETEMGDLCGDASGLSCRDLEIAEFSNFTTAESRENNPSRGAAWPTRQQFEADFRELAVRARAFIERLRRVAADIVKATPVLHKDELRILEHLLKQMTAANQYDLETATGLSRRTISDRLSRLREMGYVWRPHGPRGGEAITEAGKNALRQRPAH